jgi:hypothetical protein
MWKVFKMSDLAGNSLNFVITSFHKIPLPAGGQFLAPVVNSSSAMARTYPSAT